MKIDYQYCPKLKNLLIERQDTVSVSSKKLSIEFFDEARVLPFTSWAEGLGCVCDKYGTFIKQSAWNEDFEEKYIYHEEDFEHLSGEYLFVGVLFNCWGHTLTDNLKKIWVLHDNKYANISLCYTTIDNVELSPQAKELFYLAGIKIDDAIHITRPTIIQQLYIPENSFKFYTPNIMYRQTVNNILSCIDQTIKREKIYLSRTQWQKDSRRDNGEIEVENLFREKGYEIIYPEQLSVAEQIGIYATCDEMVATEGSTALNSIFMHQGAKLVILKKADFVNKYQNVVNCLCDLDVTYIESHHSAKADKKEPWHGPFYMYPTDNVRRYLGERKDIWTYRPYWMRISWYKYMRFVSRLLNKIKKVLNV